MSNVKIFSLNTIFESNTTYIGKEKVYDIYPSDSMEEIYAWYTFLTSGNIPLRAAFVLRGLKNVTIDLGGAKLILHGRIMPFAVFDCENIIFKNFSIDYDRPFYTQGKILEVDGDSIIIQIPELFSYRIEGHDFIAYGETWEHRLVTGDMLFRCFDSETGLPSRHSDIILGLIGDNIQPRPNPPCPIYHLYAEDLGNRCVKLWNFPDFFTARVGEILAMTHEDRRKTAFLLERSKDTVIEHVRLLHIGAMGITANLCHNITLNDYSMYIDEETPDRVVTVNADGFHTFHCTGLMKVENCRFEKLLDDAINIHGNYLVCVKQIDSKTLLVQNHSSGIKQMEYLAPGDDFVIYKGNTQEIRCRGVVEKAVFLPDQYVDMYITLKEEMNTVIEKGDCLENQRMPEIEIRNCQVRSMGGFRISTGKRVLIEDCTFETAGFSIAFTGDMDYWFENTGVKDVTIQNCKFIDCRIPLQTHCGFQPTEKAPYYHENIKFINNTIIDPRDTAVRLSDVNNFIFQNNTVSGVREGVFPIVLTRCNNVTIE